MISYRECIGYGEPAGVSRTTIQNDEHAGGMHGTLADRKTNLIRVLLR